MRLSEKGQEVVLAHAVHFDVFNEHHLIIVFLEEGFFQNFNRILAIAFRKVLPCFGYALRSFGEAFTFRIFAYSL